MTHDPATPAEEQAREESWVGIEYYVDEKARRIAAEAKAAALTAELEQVRARLVGTDVGSLPHDWTLQQIAEARCDDIHKLQWQVRDTCERAEAAESALSASEREREKLKRALADARDGLDAIAQLSVAEVGESSDALNRIIAANQECARDAIIALQGAGIRLANGGITGPRAALRAEESGQ